MLNTKISSAKVTDLFIAAQNGDVKTIEELTKNFTPFTTLAYENTCLALHGQTALQVAAANGHDAIVKRLLEKGDNPNLISHGIECTALHAAARRNQKHIVELLISYQADVAIQNDIGGTALDYANKPEIASILSLAGAVRKLPSQKQDTLIQNHTMLVNELAAHNLIHLNHPNKDGCCDGLSKMHVLNVYEDRDDEFQFYVSFLNRLDQNQIKELVQKYVQHGNKLKIILHENGRPFSFEKLLRFMQGIVKVQGNPHTFFKSIGANWDATHLISLTPELIPMEQQLKACELMVYDHRSVKQIKYLSTGGHAMLLTVTPTGAFFYDSNNTHGEIFCRNEAELAQAFISVYEDLKRPEQRFFSLCVNDLSYGDHLRELDDLLLQFHDVLQSKLILNDLVRLYQLGQMSRLDLALTLQTQIRILISPKTESSNSELSISELKELKELKELLQKFIDYFRQTTLLLPKSVHINTIINHYQQTILHLALKSRNQTIVPFLIAAGANLDATDKLGHTPLFIAANQGDLTAVQLLTSAYADINMTDPNGNTALITAAEEGYTAIVHELIRKNANLKMVNTSGRNALHAALQFGQIGPVEALINPQEINENAQMIDIDAKDNQGNTSLIFAAAFGHIACAKQLIEAGADVNLSNADGATPLIFAMEEERIKIIKLLIKAGANFEEIGVDGYTPLSIAIRKGNEEMVRILIRFGVDIEQLDQSGRSPLMNAIFWGQSKLAKQLILANANVNATNATGRSTLCLAAVLDRADIVLALIQAGATINFLTQYVDSPLMIAAQNGYTKTVQTLMDAGADLNLMNGEGNTALHLAARWGRDLIVLGLIKEKANMNLINKQGSSPLAIAAQKGEWLCAYHLVTSGASVDLANRDGCTPLYLAAEMGQIHIVRLLIVAHAHVDHINKNYWSALHVAAEKGHQDVVQVLISAHANIDIQSTHGWTGLALAAQNGHTEIVKTLIAAGANTNICTHEGFTPLMIAIRHGHLDIVRAFIEGGADIQICNKQGQSPLFIAAQHGFSEIAQLLIESGAYVKHLKTKDDIIRNGYENIANLLLPAHQVSSIPSFFNRKPANQRLIAGEHQAKKNTL